MAKMTETVKVTVDFGWISIKDKLPEPFKDVIVCGKRRDGESFVWVDFNTGNRFYIENYGTKVLYWMPLPEFPKEE